MKRSGVDIHGIRIFPGADIGSGHGLVMRTFRVCLKKAKKPNQPRLRFNLEKLGDPNVACTFQATIGGKFAPLIGLRDEDMDINTMITTYNTVVTAAASEIFGKEIFSRWTEYCSELYNHESCGDNTVLDCSQPPAEDLQPILREDVEIAVASLKRGSLPELIIYHQSLFKLAGIP